MERVEKPQICEALFQGLNKSYSLLRVHKNRAKILQAIYQQGVLEEPVRLPEPSHCLQNGLKKHSKTRIPLHVRIQPVYSPSDFHLLAPVVPPGSPHQQEDEEGNLG